MLSEILLTFNNHWQLIMLFFLIAIVYSTAGFGGGSSYLAVLSFTALAFTEIRFTALLCNIIVVSSSTYFHFKNKHYNWEKIIPLIALSIPMAFLGGYISISQSFFFVLLAITLFIASISMWFSSRNYNSNTTKPISAIKSASYGGIIGFLSGMVGIGGGIFLAPLLHLTRWDNTKKIVATSSFFILVNSIAGIIGQSYNSDFSIDFTLTFSLGLVVFSGGIIGSKLSVYKFSASVIKKITAILILVVAVRLIFKHLF